MIKSIKEQESDRRVANHINHLCPGEWEPATLMSGVWEWRVSDYEMAVLTRNKNDLWLATVVKVNPAGSKPFVDTCGHHMGFIEACDYISNHYGHTPAPDPKCEECGGAGEVKLFSTFSPCNTCGGR